MMENEHRGILTGDLLTEVFRAINPFSRQEPYTALECSIIILDIVDGLATSRAVAMQTDKLKIGAQGTLSLATEKIDFTFNIKQRRGIGVSVSGIASPFVRVSGTIMKPNIHFDAKRGTVSGTTAVLTGGLSILAKGVWGRFLSADNVCEAALERAAKAEAESG